MAEPSSTNAVQREIVNLERLTDTKVAALRTEIVTTLAGQSKALELQAAEYERRLEQLNHAHQQAVDRYATFLPREIYDTFHEDFRTWQQTLDAERASGRGQKAAYISVASMALSLITLLLVGYGILI